MRHNGWKTHTCPSRQMLNVESPTSYLALCHSRTSRREAITILSWSLLPCVWKSDIVSCQPRRFKEPYVCSSDPWGRELSGTSSFARLAPALKRFGGGAQGNCWLKHRDCLCICFELHPSNELLIIAISLRVQIGTFHTVGLNEFDSLAVFSLSSTVYDFLHTYLRFV